MATHRWRRENATTTKQQWNWKEIYNKFAISMFGLLTDRRFIAFFQTQHNFRMAVQQEFRRSIAQHSFPGQTFQQYQIKHRTHTVNSLALHCGHSFFSCQFGHILLVFPRNSSNSSSTLTWCARRRFVLFLCCYCLLLFYSFVVSSLVLHNFSCSFCFIRLCKSSSFTWHSGRRKQKLSEL